MDFQVVVVLSEAIGYLESEARKIDKRRNRWWKPKTNKPNHAREIAAKLRKLRKEY